LLNGKITWELERIRYEYVDENGEIIQISDLKNFILSKSDISTIKGKVIEKDIEEYL
jgi:hypothetical protein